MLKSILNYKLRLILNTSNKYISIYNSKKVKLGRAFDFVTSLFSFRKEVIASEVSKVLLVQSHLIGDVMTSKKFVSILSQHKLS